jgi:hypothetical protein
MKSDPSASRNFARNSTEQKTSINRTGLQRSSTSLTGSILMGVFRSTGYEPLTTCTIGSRFNMKANGAI